MQPNTICAYCRRGAMPALLAVVIVAGCATPPPAPSQAPPDTAMEIQQPMPLARVDETAMLPLLGYLQLLYRLSAQELGRERIVLAGIPQTPAVQLRLAMLLGHPRGSQDLGRALVLLEGILKSAEPAAASLHPLARILADQYHERLKLDTQNDKLAQQLKESLRRSGELQDKLDALADIERSLPVRPGAGKPLPGVAK